MSRSYRMGVFLLAAIVLATGALTATARTHRRQGPTVVSGALAQFYGYLTPVMVVDSGGELDYANFDIVLHDVVHDVKTDGVANKKKNKWCKKFDKGSCPLFWSAKAGLGETVPVKGLNNLDVGAIYTFLCTLHPGMKGRLVVAN